MVRLQSEFWRAGFWVALACALCMARCQLQSLVSSESAPSEETASVQAQKALPASDSADGSQLAIETASLPGTYPQAAYSVRLQERGGVPPFHWKVERGALPPGLKLEDDGTLHGSPERAGEFRFAISVTDSGKPQQAVQRDYVLNVVAALSLNWKTPAHVIGNRVEGSVEVSNTTGDDMDLTYDVKAVAENGRATEIGYQHFLLHHGITAMALPFGETLPRGAYVVHVNAVGEVEKKKLIYREQMQTPGALQVAVGP